MTTVIFEQDIKPIFAPYVGCMKNVVLGDAEGTEHLDLGNYDIVKRFHYQIQVAIHGYDYVDGKLRPGAQSLYVKEGKDKGEPVKKAPHPMPPSPPDGPGRLADADIKKFDDWITIGMPETDTDVVA